MAKRDKYRKKRSSDFLNYSEGKMSDQERHAFERRMQKDPFASDAAEGFSRVSREEAKQDLQSAAGRIRDRIKGQSSRNGRNRRIAWYSAAAAFASLMIVTTIFFRLNDNGLERFETTPEMREAAKEQAAPSKGGGLKKEDGIEPIAEVESKVKVESTTELEKEKKMMQVVPTEDVEEEPVDEVAMEPVDPVAEEATDQEELAGERASEQETITGKGTKKRLKEEELSKKVIVVDAIEESVVKEDHKFALEKVEEKATAVRHRSTQQQMAASEYPTKQETAKPKTAYAPQTPPEPIIPGETPQTTVVDALRYEAPIDNNTQQLPGRVSGVVRSADDLEPLPGAIVRVKDTDIGTVADQEGRFTLNATAGKEETLEVIYIGMETEEIPATTEQPMEIALMPDEVSLDEVVVIGYSSSKKSNITTSATAKEADPSGNVEYEAAVPENGAADYRSYIDTTLVYPELKETSKKEVVVLKFSINPDGQPQNFQVIRAPDNKAFENEAIRAVSEGPAWQPATRNGQYTEEEVQLRIVFKKD